MSKISVLGQSYTTRNPAVHNDVCCNYYPEKITKDDNSLQPQQQIPACVLYPTPGSISRLSGSTGSVRGMLTYAGKIYAVINTSLVILTQNSDNSLTAAFTTGSTIPGTGPVSLISNGNLGNQILICNGTSTKYYLTLATSVVAPVTDPANVVTSQCTYQQGYGIMAQSGTNQWWITNLEDFSTINSLNFASAYTKPDPIVAVFVLKLYIIIFTQTGAEIWQNTGLVTIAGQVTTFPYTNVVGSYLEQGLVSPFGICLSVNTLYWITRNERGGGQVARVGGGGLVILSPEIVSTHPIEELLLSLPTISDCISYAYQDGGHEFVVFTFPTGNATIVYDVSDNAWHQRSSTGTSTIGRHFSNCYANLGGVHYVGDSVSTGIYEMSRPCLTEKGTTHTNGTPIYREIQSQHLVSENKRQSILRLEADVMTNPASSGTTQGQIQLFTSRDGGHTYNTYPSLNFGFSAGNYEERVFWTMLGMSRNWIIRLVVTSPVDHVLMSVLADVDVGDS